MLLSTGIAKDLALVVAMGVCVLLSVLFAAYLEPAIRRALAPIYVSVLTTFERIASPLRAVAASRPN